MATQPTPVSKEAPDGTTYWYVQDPERPELYGIGATAQEASDDLQKAQGFWLTHAHEAGDTTSSSSEADTNDSPRMKIRRSVGSWKVDRDPWKVDRDPGAVTA